MPRITPREIAPVSIIALYSPYIIYCPFQDSEYLFIRINTCTTTVVTLFFVRGIRVLVAGTRASTGDVPLNVIEVDEG